MHSWRCTRDLGNGVNIEGHYANLLISMITSFAISVLPVMGINIVRSPDLMKLEEVFAPARVRARTVRTGAVFHV